MSTAENQLNGEADGESGTVGFPFVELLAAEWKHRRLIVIATAGGLLLAVVISFLLPISYTSDALVLPPDQQSLSGVTALSVLSSGAGAGGLLSTKSPGAISISILSSRTAEDDIINRFDLLKIYHCKLYVDARLVLAAHTQLDEDKKTGIVRIAVTDHDRYRARDVAKGYVEELNKMLIQENTSSAHLERVFLEGRLVTMKSELDATSQKLSQFSSNNATFNPQAQSQVLLQSATILQNQMFTAQSELEALRAQFSDDNVHVREARARVAELQKQLHKIGSGDVGKGADEGSGELSPSIRQLPLLGVTYLDLSRQLTIEEALYDSLSKQYEVAKVQEAKEIPTMKVLDEPELSERKSEPRRTRIVIFATLFTSFVALIFIGVRELLRPEYASHPFVANINSTLRSIRGEGSGSAA